jgi:oxygen-dependent protoporphyrinogen oxidase
MHTRTCDVVVVGAGLAGLTAAWRVRDLDILVLEERARPGGRIMSERRGSCWLNFGAHVFSGPDSASGRLMKETGVEAISVPGSLTAVAVNGAVVSSGPVETYPLRLPLAWPERLALARAGLKLRLAVRRYGAVARPRSGEPPAERQRRMLEFRDDRSFADFIGPLPADVAAILRSTLTRSSGEPHELAAGYGIGYFHLVWNRDEGLSRNILGGSSTLIERLADGVGDRLLLSTEVVGIEQDRDDVSVSCRGGATIRARSVVVATPAPVTRRIIVDLPGDTAEALDGIRYGPYVVGAFLTSEQGPVPWDRVYALATPKRSFSMLFNTANVLRAVDPQRRPGGSLMVYAAADLARELGRLDDDTVAARFRGDLRELYPSLADLVVETKIKRWPIGLPYPTVGRGRLQAALTKPLGRIHLAGDYLGSSYTETAAGTGDAAAAAARLDAAS